MIKKFSEILGIDLSSKSRKARVSWSRYAAYYYLWLNGYGIVDISRIFGYNHGTVSVGRAQFEEKLSINDPLAIELWEKLKDYDIEDLHD